jgi:hypothetical protein
MECGGQVDRDDRIPLLGLKFLNGKEVLDAGIC